MKLTGVASPSVGGGGSSSAGGVEHGGADARLSCARALGVSGALALLTNKVGIISNE